MLKVTINNDKSRLKEIAVYKLIVTKTLVGDGTKNSLARYVYRIWSDSGELISTLDYGDKGYEAISRSFSSLEAFC